MDADLRGWEVWRGQPGVSRQRSLGREGLRLHRSIALFHEDLDLALGGVEFLFAGRRETHALFEQLEGLFEGKVAALELIDDGFELLQRFFKGGQFVLPRSALQRHNLRG